MSRLFEGVTRTDALINASLALDARRDDLEYEVVSAQPGAVQIRVTNVRPPPPPERAVVDYRTAFAPLRPFVGEDVSLDLGAGERELAFVDFEWLEAQDEAFWATMEHDSDRVQPLRSMLGEAGRRRADEGLWGICAGVGVAGSYWLEYAFDEVKGVLVLDLRSPQVPVLFVRADEAVVIAESVAELVERLRRR
ncbi:MAG: hypothetical protein ACOZQL_33080 [Myxococcota bacterium]